MANDFSKEEKVAFEQMLEGFNDALILSGHVTTYRTDSTNMERASDTIWRPSPYIAMSRDGLDQTGNFGDATQLSVPATIGYIKSVPWRMNSLELRDALQENRLGDAARQRLASDVNTACLTQAIYYGSLFVSVAGSATGYDDVALCDSIMNEQGVMMGDRTLCLGSRDYNSMAGNLAERQTVQGPVSKAYRDAYVGQVSSFQTFKLDTTQRLTAAAGTTVTIAAANQYYTPQATSTAATGETNNVDNRFQTISIAVTSGTVKVGDAFTVEGVYAVHHITKESTGQLKTFRVTEIVTGNGGTGTVKITPPFISNGGSTEAEERYQNVDSTPANGAAITFLNIQDAAMNPFWRKDAIEILPSQLAVPTNAGASVIKGSTDNGIVITLQKQFDINTSVTKYRADCHFGTVMTNTEMAGVMMFGQS